MAKHICNQARCACLIGNLTKGSDKDMLVWERAQAFLPLPYMNKRVITERSADGGPQIGNSGCTRVLDLPVYGNLAKQMRHFAPASRCEMPFGQGALPRDGGSVMRQMVVVSLAKAVDLNWPGDRGIGQSPPVS